MVSTKNRSTLSLHGSFFADASQSRTSSSREDNLSLPYVSWRKFTILAIRRRACIGCRKSCWLLLPQLLLKMVLSCLQDSDFWTRSEYTCTCQDFLCRSLSRAIVIVCWEDWSRHLLWNHILGKLGIIPKRILRTEARNCPEILVKNYNKTLKRAEWESWQRAYPLEPLIDPKIDGEMRWLLFEDLGEITYHEWGDTNEMRNYLHKME